MPRKPALLLALTLALPALAQDVAPLVPGAAQATSASAEARHTLNLSAADIGVLIQTVSEITGRSFIVDPRVEGKVTVISAQPMDREAIWRTFESVLKVHGFAVVPAGGMWKVVPEGLAATDGGVPLANGLGPDALVTKVIEVKQVSAAELANLLRPLVPQSAQLIAQGGTLVVTDRAGNVERLQRIIRRIDTAADTAVEVIPLRHANASEVARTLTQLEAPAGGTAAPGAARLIADARSNSLLLSGDPAARLRLRTLVAHLDTPLEDGDSTQVIYLRYAKAADIVPVLEGVAATLTGTAVGGDGAKPTTIQAHEETNALVVTAAPAVYRELAAVVRSLDVRRAQVLVEAVIAEVSDDLADELGVQWQSTSLDSGDDKGVIGGTNFPDSSGGGSIVGGALNPLNAVGGEGLRLGWLGGRITLPIGEGGEEVTVFQIGALIKALRGDGRSNILSRPSVITLDHTEAEFKVAQEVPFLTGQYTSTGTGTNLPQNPFQTIERKDVGLILRVTPHVNEGDAVRLDILQEVSNLAPRAAGAVDLITNKRQIRTSVLVPDGGFLVLGGLSSEEISESVRGVPGLSRIPVLGHLFKSRASSRAKRNLMVFLRPVILRDAITEAAVSSEKYNFLRAEQLQMQQRFEGRIRGGDTPALPAQPADLFTNPPPVATEPPRD